MVNSVRNQLFSLADGNLKDLREYSAQLGDLKDQLASYPSMNYVLGQIEQDLRDSISETQMQAKQDALPQKKTFVAQYASGIKDIKETDLCATYYKDLDMISFVNNFPTALTIATRYREA
jgi:regulator of replication initiation timing